ncbi:unnamed protein product [Prorocentrum cordatum]|uniref:Uncharacterized protein n=1 Tax=Prorocentrum cordatum TaxID=2364126 RepID=A0ABN9UW18_9DINO|nr:unnamed protein product [Polarella glacialis]
MHWEGSDQKRAAGILAAAGVLAAAVREAKLWYADSSIIRDLDGFELCCGNGGITRKTGHSSEDLTTLPGMVMALFGVFRVKPRGAFWSSPECKTWLNMCMGHTRRSKGDLLGDISRTDVKEANHIAHFLRGGSMLFPTLRLSAVDPDCYNFTTYLGWFGAESVKPLTLFTNAPRDTVAQYLKSPGRKAATIKVQEAAGKKLYKVETRRSTAPRKNGWRAEWVTGAKPEQKASEQYPAAFCEMVGRLVLERRWQAGPPGSWAGPLGSWAGPIMGLLCGRSSNGMRLHRKMHELPGLDELLPPVNDKSRSKSLSPFRFFDHSKTPQRERGGHQQDTSLNEYPLPIDLLTVLTDREAPEPRAPCAAFEEAPQGENPEKPLLAVKEAGTSPGRESTLPRPRSLRRSGRRSVSRKSRTRRCSASLRNILRTAGGERGAAEAWEDEAPAHERTVGATSYMPVLAADGLAAAGHPSRPGGGSWDWPLSRLDQKARLLMIDREMLLLEREEFLEQLQRASAAAAAAPVAGSASGAPRRSTGSSRARSRRSPKESPLLGGELQASPGKGTVQHSRAAVGIGGG